MINPHTVETQPRPLAWTVRSSRVVLRDRWIHVRADDCEGPDGTTISPYYVLEYPDFVHVVAITSSDEILLIRQYRHGAGIVSLELPGGAQDKTDVSAEAAGLRELLEETGFAGEVQQTLPPLSIDPAKLTNRLKGLLVRNATRVQEPTLDPGEQVEVVKVSVADAIAMVISGKIVNAAHATLLLLGLRAAGLLSLELP